MGSNTFGQRPVLDFSKFTRILLNNNFFFSLSSLTTQNAFLHIETLFVTSQIQIPWWYYNPQLQNSATMKNWIGYANRLFLGKHDKVQDINFGQKSPNTADILYPISYKKFEFLSSAEVWRGATHATLELSTNAANEVKKSLILNYLNLTFYSHFYFFFQRGK